MKKLFLLLTLLVCAFGQKPSLLLANVYDDNIDVRAYLVSEKYDGVRAFWTGKQLLFRSGKRIFAPQWFTKCLPKKLALDGELWTKRQDFENVSSIVRDKIPSKKWKQIRYMVFDMPNSKENFQQRYELMQKNLTKCASIEVVKQRLIPSQEWLIKELKQYEALGAEGLMLHKKDSFYEGGRSDDLLKLKSFQDAEAKVIGFTQGKGKFKGLVGALVVQYQDKTFKIGSGLSKSLRQNPPKVGSIITFKYYGLTKNKIPRFASFWRLKKTE